MRLAVCGDRHDEIVDVLVAASDRSLDSPLGDEAHLFVRSNGAAVVGEEFEVDAVQFELGEAVVDYESRCFGTEALTKALRIENGYGEGRGSCFGIDGRQPHEPDEVIVQIGNDPMRAAPESALQMATRSF